MLTTGFPYKLLNPGLTKHTITREQLVAISTHLRGGYRDLLQLILGNSGIFAVGPGTPLNLAAGSANNTFKVTQGVGFIGDGTYPDWHPLIDWDDEGNIVSENQLGQVYHVGMQVALVPIPTAEGVGKNARSQQITYIAQQLAVGNSGAPSAVSYNAGADQFTITVTNLMANAGDNHGTRSVRVWLATPRTDVAAAAFLTATASFGGGAYTLVLPVGSRLGLTIAQATAAVAGDFVCLIPGPAVTITNLALNAQYLYLGNFTGAGAGNPIGAVNVSGVSRYNVVGGADLDITTLFRDHYVNATRNNDGLAKLPAPLEALKLNVQDLTDTNQMIPDSASLTTNPSTGAGFATLAGDFSARVICSSGGRRCVVGPIDSSAFTYTASRDTYWDLHPTSGWHSTVVANGAGAPAVFSGAVRCFLVVTNGTNRTTVTSYAPSYLALTRQLDLRRIRVGDDRRSSAAQRAEPRVVIRAAAGGGAGYTHVCLFADDAGDTGQVTTNIWVRHADMKLVLVRGVAWDGSNWIRDPSAPTEATYLVLDEEHESFRINTPAASFADSLWFADVTNVSLNKKVWRTFGSVEAGADLDNNAHEGGMIPKFRAVIDPGADFRHYAFDAVEGADYALPGAGSINSGTSAGPADSTGWASGVAANRGRAREWTVNCKLQYDGVAFATRQFVRVHAGNAWKLELSASEGLILLLHKAADASPWNDEEAAGAWVRVTPPWGAFDEEIVIPATAAIITENSVAKVVQNFSDPEGANNGELQATGTVSGKGVIVPIPLRKKQIINQAFVIGLFTPSTDEIRTAIVRLQNNGGTLIRRSLKAGAPNYDTIPDSGGVFGAYQLTLDETEANRTMTNPQTSFSFWVGEGASDTLHEWSIISFYVVASYIPA